MNFKKAKIALNREIGLPAEQEIQLTDTEPYADLATMNIDQAKEMAYRSRQDYQGLQAQVRAAQLQRKAAKWERLPTLDFQGNYGVTGVTGGLYHGTFVAVGTLNVPLFEEAKFRGDSGVAAANLTNLTQQLAGLKEQINQQLRDSILDVQSATELVRVAQSNVELARKELEQTTDRFQAGVDDNLPVVQAQATLANAETNLINTTSQHNQAKLGLARNLGIVDTQYATSFCTATRFCVRPAALPLRCGYRNSPPQPSACRLRSRLASSGEDSRRRAAWMQHIGADGRPPDQVRPAAPQARYTGRAR